METITLDFERFTLVIPNYEIFKDISSDDVKEELLDSNLWDAAELDDDLDNEIRLLWLAFWRLEEKRKVNNA